MNLAMDLFRRNKAEDLFFTTYNVMNDLWEKPRGVTGDYFVDDAGLSIELEMPGFDKNDININIEKQHDIDILSISGKNDKRNVSCSYRLKPNTFDYSNYMLKLELGILNIQLNRLPSVDLNSSIELKF